MPSNPGPPLETILVKRGTDGGLITRVERNLDHVVAGPIQDDMVYGVNEKGVIQNHRNERKLVQETQEHPLRSGNKWEKGRLLTVTKGTVSAGTVVDTEPGMLVINVDPTDVAHSELYIEQDAGGATPAVVKLPAQWDNVLQQYVQPYELIVAIGTTKPVIGAAYDGGIIMDAEDGPVINDEGKYQIIYTVPATIPMWQEWDDEGFSFPGLWDIILDGVAFPSTASILRPGVVYSQVAPRTGVHLMKLLHIFTHGRPLASQLPKKYMVETPGIASNLFRIGANYIHPNFTIEDQNGILEIIPASTPSNYRPEETIVAKVRCQKHKGLVYHTQIWLANERGFEADESDVTLFAFDVWLAASVHGRLKDLESPTKLILDGEIGSTMTVYGRTAGGNVDDTAEVTTFGPGLIEISFRNLDLIEVTAVGSTPLEIWATGRNQESKFDFTDNPSPGETFSLTIVGAQYAPSTYTYTFQSSVTNPGDVLIAGTLATTIDNLVRAVTLNPDFDGISYGTGTLENPFFKSAEHPAANPDRITFVGRLAFEHSLLFSGTAQGTYTVTQTGKSGARISRVDDGAGTYSLYNKSRLRNPDFRVNVPPSLTAAPTKEIVHVGDIATWEVWYRMQAEVSITYETWDGAAWVTGLVALPTVEGDDLAKVALTENTSKIRFLITNAASVARRIDMQVVYYE